MSASGEVERPKARGLEAREAPKACKGRRVSRSAEAHVLTGRDSEAGRLRGAPKDSEEMERRGVWKTLE
jgi:hypothetical protein